MYGLAQQEEECVLLNYTRKRATHQQMVHKLHPHTIATMYLLIQVQSCIHVLGDDASSSIESHVWFESYLDATMSQ